MKEENIINIVKNIGINKDAVRIYLKGLQLGSSTVLELSQKTQIPRSTIYLHLEELIANGLASKSKIDKKTLFSMADPSRLKQLLSQQLQTLSKANQKFSSTYLPQLNALNATKNTQVEWHEEYEGIIAVLEDTLNVKKLSLICSGYQHQIDNDIKAYLDTYMEKTNQLGIHTREIIGQAPDAIEYQEKHQSSLHQIKIIPRSEDNAQHIDKIIYGHNLAYISYDNYTAVIIRSPAITQSEQNAFNQLWNNL